MDSLIEKIAALGIPGLVLLITIKATGLYGAAAITTSLSVLGGPFGILAGIGTLGLMGLISQGITQFGFETIFKSVIKEMHKQGVSKEELLNRIKNFPISKSLKIKLIKYIEDTI